MTYDVIVVGAGPAGSCAAKFLAEAGAAVALVDAAKPPRKKLCAGWVSAKAVQEYGFLDAVRRKVRAAAFKRLVFHSPDLKQTAEFVCRRYAGFIVRREAFDAELVRRAAQAGAETFLGRAVTAVEMGEHEAAVRLASGRRLAGRLLVGADGVNSFVARAVGLRPHWEPDQLVACLAKTVPLTAKQRAACFGRGTIHVSLGFGRANGYAWAFPGTDAVSVGLGVRGADGMHLKALYEAWVAGLRAKGMLPAGADLADPDAAVVPAGAALEVESHVGKRTLLIGDAGGFASAATGEGIYPGIQSAAIAVRAILKALDADHHPKRAVHCQDELQTFKHQWRQIMAAHLQMPNVNVAFLLPLIYTNQEIADRFGRAFLFGDNL